MLSRFLFFVIFASCFTSMLGCMTAAPIVGATTGILAHHDRRTMGAIVDDQTLSIKANAALSRDKELWKNSHISTLNYNKTILLVGQVPEESFKNRIYNLLSSVKEIEKIEDQLTVGPCTSFSSRINDSWLTTKIKSKILSMREIGPNRVSVITEEAKVYLMGSLTKDEADLVVENVSKIKGVEEVITLFEDYIKYQNS